jgi:hypothetical protein
VEDPFERSIVGSHANAYRYFLQDGDESRLWPFEGQTVNGRPLATDPGLIEDLAVRYDLSFEDIYEDLTGEGVL